MKTFFIYFSIVMFHLDEILSHNQRLQNQQHPSRCLKEEIIINGTKYTWPTEGKSYYSSASLSEAGKFISHPVCFNKEDEIVTRSCVNGLMVPRNPSCEPFKMGNNLYCPEELLEIPIRGDHFLCLRISSRTSFSERFCYGSDRTILDLKTEEYYVFLNYIENVTGINEFWIPARRTESSSNISDSKDDDKFSQHNFGNLDFDYETSVEDEKERLRISTLMTESRPLTTTASPTFSAVNNNSGDNDVGIYSPVVWRLPGENWGEFLDEKLYNQLSPEQCVSVKINKFRQISLTMTNCAKKLPNVCIFKKDFVVHSICPKNYGALSYEPLICYGVRYFLDEEGNYGEETNSEEINNYDDFYSSLADINYVHEIRFDNRFKLILDEIKRDKSMCVVKLSKNKSRNNLSEVLFYQSSKNRFVFREILPESGGMIYESSYESDEVLLCSYDIKRIDYFYRPVKMFLSFNERKNLLILTIYNRHLIWREKGKEFGIKCFTNADYELIHPVKIKDIVWEDYRKSSGTKTLLKLKLYGDGPGYYWCEAFTVFNFEFIRTPKIVATKKRKGHPFAFYFRLSCKIVNCYNLYKNMKNYGKEIEKILNDHKESTKELREHFKSLIIHNVRVMRIESIQPQDNINVLCHATISLRSSGIDNSSEESSEEDDDERNEKGVRHDTVVRWEMKSLLIELLTLIQREEQDGKQQSITANSTELCFPDPLTAGIVNSFRELENENFWETTKLGSAGTTVKLCLLPNGLPLTRKCVGNFLYGATWEPIHHVGSLAYCSKNILYDKLITKNLFEIEHSQNIKSNPDSVVEQIKMIIIDETKERTIIPADLFFLGRIMQTISNNIIPVDILSSNNFETNFSNTTNINGTEIDVLLNKFNTVENVVDIYNYIMNINSQILRAAAKLNSTNILLEAFESTIDQIYEVLQIEDTVTQQVNNNDNGTFKNSSNNLNTTQKGTLNGVTFQISSKLMIFSINPIVSNISGISLLRSDAESFLETDYEFLYSNQSTEELLENENIEIATFAPEILLENLKNLTMAINNGSVEFEEDLNSPKIIIKIYYNDNLFQEMNIKERAKEKVFSKIISISIPGYDRNLPQLFPIILRADNEGNFSGNDTFSFNRQNLKENWNSSLNGCRYWNYTTWDDEGLELLAKSNKTNLALYGTSHLTPFAYLIGGSFNLSVEAGDDFVYAARIYEESLDIITLLGCSLSLIGIFGIFITAILFQTWRQKASSKVLLQLSAAIALQMILFCFVNTEVLTTELLKKEIYSSCIALGALLHYSVLVQFSWMLIIAYLQYKRYVQILGNSRPTRFFLKSFIFGWGLPLIPVGLVLIIKSDAYIPLSYDNSEYDEISSKICYPTGDALYFGVILPIGVIILANLIVFFLIIYNITCRADIANRQTENKIALAQLRLSILLFFLLGFAWIFGLLEAMKAGIIFSYLFCLTATLQGFVIFIYFVILDPVTRKLWSNYIQSLCNTEMSKKKNMKSVTDSSKSSNNTFG